MTTTPERIPRQYLVHGVEEHAGTTVPVTATTRQEALGLSGLSYGWIHDDSMTCPRCPVAVSR